MKKYVHVDKVFFLKKRKANISTYSYYTGMVAGHNKGSYNMTKAVCLWHLHLSKWWQTWLNYGGWRQGRTTLGKVWSLELMRLAYRARWDTISGDSHFGDSFTRHKFIRDRDWSVWCAFPKPSSQFFF